MQLDTLKAKKRLVDEYGLPERHAEGIVELLSSAETRLATKQEMDQRFDELREEMDRRFDEVDRRLDELREEMDRRFEQMEARFDRKLETTIADLERRLTVRIFAASGALAAFIAVLNYVMG